jgi:hypothetical protein
MKVLSLLDLEPMVLLLLVRVVREELNLMVIVVLFNQQIINQKFQALN